MAPRAETEFSEEKEEGGDMGGDRTMELLLLVV